MAGGTTAAGTTTAGHGPTSGDVDKKDMWSSMLDGVASGKRLPEKSILVLGGSPETQKSFLENLSGEASAGNGPDRHSTQPPPVANQFALGYAYHDVMDTDHEDILARLSLYLLADPSPAFTPLLRPLLTPQTIPNTLIVILLDWTQPWSWLRELREWVCLLRSLLTSLDDGCKDVMEETMIGWRDRGRGGKALDGAESNVGGDGDVSLPLGPGEWDEALGVPLCVVCQNAENIDALEKEQGWKEEEFDFVLQVVRTILLKHGASLIYTSPSIQNSLQPLVHSSLGIQSLLKRQSLKHNVVDRDKVLIPPNWDSWGKIRVLREGFDAEGISTGWSVDIQTALMATEKNGHLDNGGEGEARATSVAGEGLGDAEEGGALAVYEDTIRDPRGDAPPSSTSHKRDDKIDVGSTNSQDFLSGQLDAMEKLRAEEEQSRGDDETLKSPTARQNLDRGGNAFGEEGRRVNEHIGPVQFNMGGIQVDADDMLKRLKERETLRTPEPQASSVTSPDGKSQNEALASFFAGLMKKGGSAANSPRS